MAVDILEQGVNVKRLSLERVEDVPNSFHPNKEISEEGKQMMVDMVNGEQNDDGQSYISKTKNAAHVKLLVPERFSDLKLTSEDLLGVRSMINYYARSWVPQDMYQLSNFLFEAGIVYGEELKKDIEDVNQSQKLEKAALEVDVGHAVFLDYMAQIKVFYPDRYDPRVLERKWPEIKDDLLKYDISRPFSFKIRSLKILNPNMASQIKISAAHWREIREILDYKVPDTHRDKVWDWLGMTYLAAETIHVDENYQWHMTFLDNSQISIGQNDRPLPERRNF